MKGNEQDEAAERGRQAAVDEQSTATNPYEPGSNEARSWAAGWRSVKAAEGNAAPDDI